MKKIRSALAFIVAIAMMLSSLAIGIYGANDYTIGEGDTIELQGSDEYVFTFVPEKDGCYVFSSESEDADPLAMILDSEGDVLASNDDRNVEDYNFSVGYIFEAGKTYYLNCYLLGNEEKKTYTVSLRSASLATSAELIPVYSEGDTVGSYTAFLINPIPEGSFCPPLDFYVEDESIAEIEGYDSLACGVLLKKIGTTTIHGVSEEYGIYAEAEITCVAPAQIYENDIIWVDDVVQGVPETFTFIPESSGCFVFSTDFGVDVHMYDSEFYCISTNSYSEEFYVNYTKAYLEKGETYYLRSVCYSGYETYPVTLRKGIPAESIEISRLDYGSVFVGSEVHFEALFQPYYVADENVEWSVSDSSIAELISNDKICGLIFKAQGEVTLTAISESGLTASVTVGTDSFEGITLDEKVVVYPSEQWDFSLDAEFMFVPEESGTYVFYSEGDTDTVGYIVDAEYGDTIVHCDDRYDQNFVAYAHLEAGRAYILHCESFGTPYESYEVCITRGTKAESVSISTYSGHFYKGGSDYFHISFGALTACPEDYTIYVSASDLCKVTAMGEDAFELSFLKAGTVTVFIETESGLVSESLVIEVNEAVFSTLKLDDAVDIKADGGEDYFFEFVPEVSGSYTIFSYNNECDPFVRYIDSDLSEIDYDDDGGMGVNFRMELYMEAGETYRFCVSKFGEEEQGFYSVMITEARECEGITVEGSVDAEIPYREFRGYSINCEPLGTVDRIWEIIIEDTSVVSLMGFADEWFELSGDSVGTTTVTVITEGGHSQSFTVKVVENEWISPEIIPGDINDDGTANAMDCNLMKRYMAGTYNDINERNADINEDGRVDIIDANLLVRLVAGQV